MKKHKKIILCCFLFLGLIIAAFSAITYTDYHKCINIDSGKVYDITVKQYATGETVTFSAEKNTSAILSEIENIKSKGLRFSNSPIAPDDMAYSVIISCDDYYCILTTAKDENHHYLIAKKFTHNFKQNEPFYAAVVTDFDNHK